MVVGNSLNIMLSRPQSFGVSIVFIFALAKYKLMYIIYLFIAGPRATEEDGHFTASKHLPAAGD